jgi:cilia- and flagella-associated protein 57
MTSLNNLGLQSVTLTPRFIFGINGKIKKNLHVVEEKKLLYVVGHNVVIYNIDEKSQHFIPGTEGTEGINAISVSQNARYLAVCERGVERA